MCDMALLLLFFYCCFCCCCCVPCRRSGLSPQAFRSQYETRNRPVLLTDGAADWPALAKWSQDYLAAAFAGRPVSNHQGQGVKECVQQPGLRVGGGGEGGPGVFSRYNATSWPGGGGFKGFPANTRGQGIKTPKLVFNSWTCTKGTHRPLVLVP
jgi:hypothetical protein